MEFKNLSDQKVYAGKVFDLIQRKVRFPDGRQAEFDILLHGGAVTVLPVDDQGQVHFVRQFRPAIEVMLLELPAGTLEDGEAPEVCAQRELREEIGMGAGELVLIGEYYSAPGYSTEYMYLFLGRSLTPDRLETDPDEYLSVERIPLKEVYRMLHAGELRDAKTVAALALAHPHLDLA